MLNHRTLLLSVGAIFLVSNAFATAQIPDEILIDGRSEMLFSEPLNEYLKLPSNLARLKPFLSSASCSGSWRGYRATWEVVGSHLYLKELATDPCNKKPTPVPLGSLFPFTPQPVLANWYSGKIVVPLGKQLQYIHLGYESRYERYIVFHVRNGEVYNRQETGTPLK